MNELLEYLATERLISGSDAVFLSERANTSPVNKLWKSLLRSPEDMPLLLATRDRDFTASKFDDGRIDGQGLALVKLACRWHLCG